MEESSSIPTLKDELKSRLRQTDPEYRYYKSIFNLIGGMVAITDGYRIIDANQAFSDFFTQEQINIFESSFDFSSLLLRIDKYGYVYEGYLNQPWYNTILRGGKKHYKIGISGIQELYSFSISLSLLDLEEEIFVITLSDVTDMMSYKGVLEEGIRTSTYEKEETEYILHQYNQAIDVSNLVARCDLNGTITYANQALCQTLQYKSEELVGKNVSMMFEASYETVCQKMGPDSIYEGKVWTGILKNIGKYGSLHYFATTIVPIKNQENQVVEVLSIRHDITEMMQAKEEALQTLAAKTKFFDQVSHELRTPLNAIVNFTDQALESYDEIIEDESSRELVKRYLQRAYANAEHLLELINSLLDIAKMKSGKAHFNIQKHDAISIAKEAFENCASLDKKGEIQYEFICNHNSLHIQCDPFKLRQIIINLLSNALKFTHDGYVRLHLYEINGLCYIDIEDSGIGIPEDKLTSVFDPFEQVRDHGFGTGLGLNIVREYGQAMGMEIHVDSEINVGSRFSIISKKL